jgi:hypothetical protein
MHIPVLKRFRPVFFTGFVCLAAGLALSSCSKKPQQAIVGKWNAQENNSVVEFRTDGTVTTSDKDKTSSANYRFLNDTNLEIEMGAAVNTNKIVVRLSCALAIHGDAAELTLNLPGQGDRPPQTKVMHLSRIK